MTGRTRLESVIALADTPLLSGLAFRRLCLGDYWPGLAAVRAGCAAYDGVDPRSVVESVPTADELARSLAASTAFDAAHDALVVILDGIVIGCSTVGWWTETDCGDCWSGAGADP
jgi:mycothiol synthase